MTSPVIEFYTHHRQRQLPGGELDKVGVLASQGTSASEEAPAQLTIEVLLGRTNKKHAKRVSCAL